VIDTANIVCNLVAAKQAAMAAAKEAEMVAAKANNNESTLETNKKQMVNLLYDHLFVVLFLGQGFEQVSERMNE